MAALQKIYDGPRNPRTGESIFPGFARGSEAGWTGMVRPTTAASGLLVYFSNLVYQNPEWDLRTFNFDSDMTHTDQTVGQLGNATSTDYAAAIRRGVKIIQYHGWNDQTLQPAYSPQYYEQVAKANGGLEKTQEFYRLFMVPGLAHCSGGIGASNFGGVGQQLPPVRDAAHDLRDRAGELGRTRRAAGAIHRHEVHRQRGRDQDRAVHTSGVSLSGRAAIQGDGRSERRRELRVRSID